MLRSCEGYRPYNREAQTDVPVDLDQENDEIAAHDSQMQYDERRTSPSVGVASATVVLSSAACIPG